MDQRLFRPLVLLLLAVLLGVASAGCDFSIGQSDDPAQSDDASTDAAEADPAAEEADDGETEPAKAGDEKDGAGVKDKKKKTPAVPVEVAALGRGAIESVLKSTATLEAERQVKVFSEAARLVRELLVEEGDRVRKGQVLVRLQDEEQRNALSRVTNELAQAEREYKRQERLYAEELISEEEFNQATFDLEQLRISLSDAERGLSYTEVKAPISGTVTQRMVNLGDQITVGQHLFDLVDFDSLVARIYVPEKNLPSLRAGQTARLAVGSAGSDYTARVKRIAPIVDPKSGTVKVTIHVGGQSGLRPGMYVDVDLVTSTRRDAVLVPKRAVVYDNDQMFVFRLGDERRVERVFIEPRVSDKHNIEPIEGLEEGDQVVIAGQAGLKDGARVRLPGDPDEEDKDEKSGEDGKDAVERASL